MFWNKQTKRNLAILLMAMAVVGLTMTAWAKKPDNPGGGKPGGGDGNSVGTGTIYYSNDGYYRSMNPDGSGKTPLLAWGEYYLGDASIARHPAEADRWFLQVHTIPGEFYPITALQPLYYSQTSGLDDLEVIGFTGDPDPDIAWGTIHFYIDIDGEGEPDTFKWYIGGGAPPGETGVPITGDYQELHIDDSDSNYLTIKFDYTTGHARTKGYTYADAWWMEVKKTQRHELFAVREDGLIEVQLTDDPNVQPWRPGDPSRALQSWATHDGVVDGKVSYLAQRWDKDAQDEDVVVERGIFVAEIDPEAIPDIDPDGNPTFVPVQPTRLPVSMPLELGVLEIPYDWSPDGEQIVYSAGGIRVANAYEEPNEWLCNGWTPRWSPVLDEVGSTLIAFRTGAEIRTIDPDLDGAPTTTIVTAGKNRTFWGGIYWSPNGTHLIYTRIQRKKSDSEHDVYRVGADGSDPTNLTNGLKENAFSMGWRD